MHQAPREKSSIAVIDSSAAGTTARSTATQLDVARTTQPSSVVVLESQRPLADARLPRRSRRSRSGSGSSEDVRRVRGREMNVRLARKANEIIREHHKKAYGTDIPCELDGKSYVGRIERHYHPPGGELLPWGYHPGCSLFAVEAE